MHQEYINHKKYVRVHIWFYLLKGTPVQFTLVSDMTRAVTGAEKRHQVLAL